MQKPFRVIYLFFIIISVDRWSNRREYECNANQYSSIVDSFLVIFILGQEKIQHVTAIDCHLVNQMQNPFRFIYLFCQRISVDLSSTRGEHGRNPNWCSYLVGSILDFIFIFVNKKMSGTLLGLFLTHIIKSRCLFVLYIYFA